MKKALCASVILFLVCALPLLAAAPVTDIDLLRQEARALLVRSNTRWVESDLNGDGKIDHLMLLTPSGDKIYEEIDTNHDGNMDTLSYYSRGVLAREEIDTNFDGKIDLWVFIKDGIYVERYMRDTDHDGVIDVTKEYGPGKR